MAKFLEDFKPDLSWWLPPIVGYREERNPRWLWLRKRWVPIFDDRPVTIDWRPTEPDTDRERP